MAQNPERKLANWSADSDSLASSQEWALKTGQVDCASGEQDIRTALQKLKGVKEVVVDVVGGKVQVRYARGVVAPADIANAIRNVGYNVEEEAHSNVSFIVQGMDCADDVRQIQNKLGRLSGASKLQFDLLRHRLLVEGTVTGPEVQGTLRTLGMDARLENEAATPVTFWRKHGSLIMAAVSGVFLAAAGLLIAHEASYRLTKPLLRISAIAGSWFVARRGLRAARNDILDVNFLMTIAAVGAALIGEWGECASAMFLFSVAQLLESHSRNRARNAIKGLMTLAPPEAAVKRVQGEVAVPISTVKLGETVIVGPGLRVPLDGIVLGGRSSVDQAPITGESVPVNVELGSQVFAGSINKDARLEIRVTKLAEDTTLARIIHTVEKAQASRAPSQSFVDHFSRIYTPGVVSLAALVAIVPLLLGTGVWTTWPYRALTMLVIACPGALAISTPVVIVRGLARAAGSGVLIKDAVHLENAGSITTIAFDKTGTLTLGRPRVTEIIPLNGHDPEQVLTWATALERGSQHPLAAAVLEEAERHKMQLPAVTDFKAYVGQGVRGTIAGAVMYFGNERLCQELGHSTPESEEALRSMGEQGKTALLLFSDREPIGVIAITDRVRPQAADAIQSLRWLGLKRILMLTGDNEKTANGIAAELRIADYRAELLPDDKVAIVRGMETSGERVAFVGDALNDAPALASATLGIAMGAAGTGVALETADIAVMADDLSRIPFAIRLSRQTLGIIKQNIWFSIMVKAVFMVLVVMGWASLWMAVAADIGASLAVIANGLRVLRVRS